MSRVKITRETCPRCQGRVIREDDIYDGGFRYYCLACGRDYAHADHGIMELKTLQYAPTADHARTRRGADPRRKKPSRAIQVEAPKGLWDEKVTPRPPVGPVDPLDVELAELWVATTKRAMDEAQDLLLRTRRSDARSALLHTQDEHARAVSKHRDLSQRYRTR